MILTRRSFLFLMLAALQVLDASTTLAVIGVGGIEGNPIMRNTAHGNPWIFLFWKLLAVVLLAVFVRASRGKAIKWFDPGLIWVVTAYLAVVSWNLYNLNTVIGAT